MTAVFFVGSAQATEVELPTHVLTKAKAKEEAILVLFPGWPGSIYRRRQKKLNNNFIVRVHNKFPKRFTTILVGPRQSDPSGYSEIERKSEAHRKEVQALVKKYNPGDRPVILIGTSHGVISAAAIAKNSKYKALILTAGTNRDLVSLNMKEYLKPTLVVHHKEDGCFLSPFSDAKKLVKTLPKGELLATDGGAPARSGPCQAKSYHGFWGIEPMVVDKMSAWISKILASKK